MITPKLTVIFTGCGQVGIDEWANYHTVRTIILTDEQIKLLTPPQNMSISNVIFDKGEED